jgi:hypothetical protein
VFTVPQRK